MPKIKQLRELWGITFGKQVVGELQEVEFFPWAKTFEQDWQALKLACDM